MNTKYIAFKHQGLILPKINVFYGFMVDLLFSEVHRPIFTFYKKLRIGTKIPKFVSDPSSQIPALVASYRLCPEYSLSESLSDAIASYNYLLQQIPAKNIIIGGNSAGAFLCLLLLHSLQNQNQNLPSLAILSSLAPYSEIIRLPLADWSTSNAGIS